MAHKFGKFVVVYYVLYITITNVLSNEEFITGKYRNYLTSLKNASPEQLENAIYDHKMSNYGMIQQGLLDVVSKLYKNTFKNEKIVTLGNLNEILKQFTNDNCLIVMNYFHEHNILPQGNTPTILRNINLAQLRHILDFPDFSVEKYDLVWAPSELLNNFNNTFEDISQSAKHYFNRTFSKHKQKYPCAKSKLYPEIQ